MIDVWSWISALGTPSDWPSDRPAPSLLLASSGSAAIVLQADRPKPDAGVTSALVAFSLVIRGFQPSNRPSTAASRTLWVSPPIPLSSAAGCCVLLLTQLLDEVILSSPTVPSLHVNLVFFPTKLDAGVVGRVLESAADGEASSAPAAFLSLALIHCLFWVCALGAPADVGFLFFRALGPAMEQALDGCQATVGAFLRAVGPDIEERYTRSLGYMLSKWHLLKEIQESSSSMTAKARPSSGMSAASLSYAANERGLWILKGYSPVLAMHQVGTMAASSSSLDMDEAALRYCIAHQQLAAVVHMEPRVCMRDPRFILVGVRIANIRVHVVRLAFKSSSLDGAGGEDDEHDGMVHERHFPSRVCAWVGPEVGAGYATGPLLGRSTVNLENETETTRVVKGSFLSARNAKGSAASGMPAIKAKVRSSTKARSRNWRWEQEAEGSAAVFDGVLYDTATGTEISSWRPDAGGGDPRSGMRRRCAVAARALSKAGGLVVAADEVPEEVTWRVGREMEGKTVTWRVGLKVWASYVPNEARSSNYETRCAEWRHELKLHLGSTP